MKESRPRNISVTKSIAVLLFARHQAHVNWNTQVNNELGQLNQVKSLPMTTFKWRQVGTNVKLRSRQVCVHMMRLPKSICAMHNILVDIDVQIVMLSVDNHTVMEDITRHCIETKNNTSSQVRTHQK